MSTERGVRPAGELPRFFVPPSCIKKGRALLARAEAHHVLNVLRLGPGDRVVVFDGTGREYEGVLGKRRRDSLPVSVTESTSRREEHCTRLCLAQAVIKAGKFELVVQKATELGAGEIIPILTHRSLPVPGKHSLEKKLERWERIAVSAAKQSGRTTLPQIKHPAEFSEAIERIGEFSIALIPDLRASKTIQEALDSAGKRDSVIIFIGPEGGFTDLELGQAVAKGCTEVLLNRNILRSETAAIATCSIIMAPAEGRKSGH